MADLIDRQETLNKIANVFAPTPSEQYIVEKCIDALNSVQSAEMEFLTDKEQRIFLSAMERERKVCRQVDEEWRNLREPYEDSLVHVCNEIERKVKGSLWT